MAEAPKRQSGRANWRPHKIIRSTQRPRAIVDFFVSISRNAEHRAPLKPRIALDTPTGRYGPRVEIWVIEFDDGLDVLHAFGKALGFFPVLQNPAAKVGVQPNKVRHGGMARIGFECVRHAPEDRPAKLERFRRLRHNTARTDVRTADEAQPVDRCSSVSWTLSLPSLTSPPRPSNHDVSITLKDATGRAKTTAASRGATRGATSVQAPPAAFEPAPIFPSLPRKSRMMLARCMIQSSTDNSRNN